MLEKTLDLDVLLEPKGILDLLVDTKLAQSKREARQFIQSGAITINDQKIEDIDYLVTSEHSLHDQYKVIRRGKKKYALVSFK